MQARLPASISEPCAPLPALQVQLGQDLRPALLENRAETERVHAECAARHRAAVQAINPRPPRPPRPERTTP